LRRPRKQSIHPSVTAAPKARGSTILCILPISFKQALVGLVFKCPMLSTSFRNCIAFSLSVRTYVKRISGAIQIVHSQTCRKELSCRGVPRPEFLGNSALSNGERDRRSCGIRSSHAPESRGQNFTPVR
jgi:hypothetical protein